jgi:predicted phosphodiesterase
MTVKIAHLSDLHFGMKGQREIWKSLRTYLCDTLKPDLVLVTGDIVDTPRTVLYKEAAEELDRFRNKNTKCYVCPGNHDRHKQGNTVAGLSPGQQWTASRFFSWFQKRQPSDDKLGIATPDAADADSSQFDKYFSGMLLQIKSPMNFNAESGNLKWKIRLIGLDSSADAQYFAQGHILPEVMQELRSVLSDPSSDQRCADLVITLVHHHLLPVMGTETSTQTLAGALSGTTVLNNAGSLLEALTCGVDIVLHGHKHARHVARYSSFEEQRGDVTVIGAGSATGAVTGKGCELTKASFNLLELNDDASVTLAEVSNKGDGWKIRRPQTDLLDPKDIRRGRFFRRSPNAAPPKSRWSRHVEFTASRDRRIRESLVNWVIVEPHWQTITENSSGKPYFVQGEIELEQGKAVVPLKGVGFESMGGGQFGLRHTLAIPPGTQFVRRIDQEILWVGGAALTRDDLKRCSGRSDRSSNRESISAHVTNGLESLSLSLELPSRFCPENNAFEVAAETQDGRSCHQKELQDRLVVTGGFDKVRAALTIPYPQPGVRYVISWPLPEIEPVAPGLKLVRDQLENLAPEVVNQMVNALGIIFPGIRYSVAVYIPEVIQEKLSFRMLASNGASPSPNERVRPTVNEDSFCIAYWGVPHCLVAKEQGSPDQDERGGGLIYGETAMFSVPVANPSTVGLLSANEESLAIIRVGWSAKTEGRELLPTMVNCGKVATLGLLPLLKE